MMDNEKAAALLKSVGLIDQAKIFEGSTQRPFQIQKLVLDLSTAVSEQDPRKIGIPFKSLVVKLASDNTVSVNFKPNSRDTFQSAIPLEKNDVLNYDYPISESYLYWDEQPGKSMTIFLMTDAKFTSGSIISNTSGGVSVSEGTSVTTSAQTLVTTTAASIFSSNSSRSLASFINLTTDIIYVGSSSSVTDSDGFPVAPGETFPWKNTAELYGYAMSGGEIRKMEQEL